MCGQTMVGAMKINSSSQRLNGRATTIGHKSRNFHADVQQLICRGVSDILSQTKIVLIYYPWIALILLYLTGIT